MHSKDKIRVGVLRGGTEEHYHASIRKGGELIAHILDNLSHKYKPFDILIDKEGIWHVNGLPVDPSKLLYKVDMVWNLSHQRFSNILESFSIRNVGTPPFSPFLEISREMLRKRMEKVGIKMPKHIIIPSYQKDFDGPRERYAIKKAKEVFEKFSAPWIVKSYTEDANQAIHLAKTFGELAGAIEDGAAHGKSILVEEFIPGKVASVHSVPMFRGEDIYTFPLGNSFGVFSSTEKEKLFMLAKNLHNHIGARHYLKSDFLLNNRGKVYLLGFELMPDLKPDSHFSQVCEQVGAKTHNVIEHILETALN